MKSALIYLLTLVVVAKKLTQRHKFYQEDFFYSTKFGAPANYNLLVKYRARLLNYAQ